MRILVAITGASGAIYARQVLQLLLDANGVERIGLILSDHAEDVITAEGEHLPDDVRITRFENDDMWSSARHVGMP